MKDLIVFDMDGVLVDVNESYRATIQATVQYFTGQELTRIEIQDWKNRGGWNDDWELSHRLIQERGTEVAFQKVVDRFQEIFLGDGTNGLILRELWVAKDGLFDRLSAGHSLAVFTGRLRWEAHLTLKRFAADALFDPVIGVDDVARSKPDPEGLLKIRDSVEHERIWYVGDTIDDARASSAARVPFIGIAARSNPRYEDLERLLREENAVAVLDDINDLEAAIAANR